VEVKWVRHLSCFFDGGKGGKSTKEKKKLYKGDMIGEKGNFNAGEKRPFGGTLRTMMSLRAKGWGGEGEGFDGPAP